MKSFWGRVVVGVVLALGVILTLNSPGAGAASSKPATSGAAVETSACPAGTAAVTSSTLKVVGGLATGTFSIGAGCAGVKVTLASYMTSSASFSLPQTLYKSSTNSFDTGGPFSLSVDVPSCFYQVDLVVGGVIETLDTGHLYNERKLAFENGGSGSCTPPPPPPPAVCPSADQAVTGGSLVISGGVATGTFSIAPGCSDVRVSLASYQAPGATFALPQTLFDSATGLFGAGGPYTLTADVPSCFYQVDLVRGSVIETLTATNLYYERKIAFANGGAACTTTTPPVQTVVTPPVATVTPSETKTPSSAGAIAGTSSESPSSAPAPAAPQMVDVSITKVADQTSVNTGASVGYTITATNSGPGSADGVTVAEDLPAGLTLVSATPTVGTCAGSGPVLCSLGTLAPGASASIRVETTASAAGTVVNTATVSTSSLETNTANNTAQATVNVKAGAFTPPVVCRTLSLSNPTFLSTKRSTFTVHVKDAAGQPVANARIRAKGPGVALVQRTSKTGVARFAVKPRSAGAIEVTLLQAGSCTAQSAVFQVLAAAATQPSFAG